MVNYGAKCRYDTDCKSSICEMTYNQDGSKIGRRCVIQKPKSGKKCLHDGDCLSGRCRPFYDTNETYLGKKCLVIRGEQPPPKKILFGGEEISDEYRDKQAENTIKKKVFFDPAYRSKITRDGGPVKEFVVFVLEIILDIIKSIFDLLFNIWWKIFLLVYDIFLGSIDFSNIFGSVSQGLSGRNPMCFDLWFLRHLITFLFPPMGVFMSVGLAGFTYIFICCLLTLCFYFPGLIYALIIIRGNKKKSQSTCKKSKNYVKPTLKSDKNYLGSMFQGNNENLLS